MPFALKKVLGVLLSPMVGGMLFLFLAFGLTLTKRFARAGRVALFCGLALAYLLGTSPVAEALIAPLEFGSAALLDPQPWAGRVRWVVVLGSGHTSDPRAVPAARLGPEALYRLAEGIRLQRALPASTLVLSGYGGTDTQSQARSLLQAGLGMGLDSMRVRLEEAPRDTGEEADAVARLVGDGEPFVLVTSAAHMPRALYLFRARGLDPIPAPAQAYALRSAPRTYRDYFPSAGNYVKVERAVYELLGLAWARLTVRGTTAASSLAPSTSSSDLSPSSSASSPSSSAASPSSSAPWTSPSASPGVVLSPERAPGSWTSARMRHRAKRSEV